ncbi:uncharacterized protein LOC141643754 [Silene latifolia]|uniref:uncharacterized protein LOC141643754 n=1 Tax=Silene latifolia TaxID=37657 RepID=UPI003D776C59
MGSTFNPQILVEKLAKLNSSQQSIETLSHWCIFHMNKSKLVVETWDKQFHCSARDQKLPFLYLANDILQNSRRKGVEFVAEFWRVLPEALRDVIRNGDDAERNAARRLISIWDDRKVFGSRGHILKEEFVSTPPENSNRSGRQPNPKLRQRVGNVLDKIASDFEMLYGGELDEDALMTRCASTISILEKVVKDFGSGVIPGKLGGSGSTEEIQGQHVSLRECIEQLTTLESSRANLVSHLRDALQEEESKLDQLRSQLQVAQLQSDQVTTICLQFSNSDNMALDEQGSSVPPGYTLGESQAPPVIYTRQASLSDNKPASDEDESRKSAAAAVAAKLTASTSSAEMLSLALTSLVSGAAFGNNNNNNNSTGTQESPTDHRLEKRAKLENEPSSFASPAAVPPPPPPQNQQPPPPSSPFLQNGNNNTATSQQMTPSEQPPPPSSSPPPLPPLPTIMPPYPMPPQYIQTVGSMSNVAYTYGVSPQPPQPLCAPGYMPVGAPYGPPGNQFQPYQVSEGGFYTPPSTVPMASMSHQQSL